MYTSYIAVASYCRFIFILSLLLTHYNCIPISTTEHSYEDGIWVDSLNLTQWYTPLDMCLLKSNSRLPMEEIMKTECEQEARLSNVPLRCTVGSSWPSKSGFCSADDIPYNERDKFRKALHGYDDPTARPLYDFFNHLSQEKGALLIIGDSVMQQFVGAIACELEREGIWKDKNYFTNTDEVRYVEIIENVGVPIKFLPIYHFVNGKYDRIANASMHHLQSTVEDYISHYASVTIIVNMGLHYVSTNIPGFARKDYGVQMTEALTYLHNAVIRHLGSKTIRLLWRETSAQHFPTPDGYWPGAKYAAGLKLSCVGIQNPSGDWRNSDVASIIQSHRLHSIDIIPFYNMTVPLHSQHVNGHKQDWYATSLSQPSIAYLFN